VEREKLDLGVKTQDKENHDAPAKDRLGAKEMKGTPVSSGG